MNFLFPLGLAAGALAIPLIALYFLRVRRRTVKVPSLMLWHAVQRSERLASPLHRFRRNLLLLLQLLLLALLVLAFSRPYLMSSSGQHRSVVLLVDQSASMAATDGAPTRLDQARQEAQRVIDALGTADEVMLIGAGSQTEVVVPFTREAAKVEKALEALTVSESEGSLREGLQLALSLARSRPDVEVVVLSDGGGEDLSTLPPTSVPIQYVRTGRKADNAGIIALDLRRSPVSELERQLFVTVANYGRDEVGASVQVSVDGEVVAVRNELLPPDTPTALVFDLAAGARGQVHVQLDAPGDVLPVDDEAWAVLGDVAAREVLLVGGDALTARVLRADPRVNLTQLSPAAVDANRLRAADAVLFGAAVPPDVDGLNYAVLGPYGGPATLGDTEASPQVLGWQRSHPTLRFVNFDGARIGRAYTVTDLGGLVPVVDGDIGPLVLAGERQGGRVVQLAFDPFESDLPLRVAWPVLVLNTVGWLTEGTAATGEAALVPTGAPVVRTVDADVTTDQVRATGPMVPEVSVNNKLLRVSGLDAVGVYEISAGEDQVVVAANLLSEMESRVAPRPLLSLGTAAEGEITAVDAAVPGRREIWRELLLAALGVLLLEWMVWNRRRVG